MVESESETPMLPGQRLRAYDYNPENMDGVEVYCEGVILERIEAPFLGWLITCDNCTGNYRVGKTLTIPQHIASHEFDGRVIPAPSDAEGR